MRTDLGGVYFNLLLALMSAGVYVVTGYQPLLLLVVGQQLLVLDQFVPWIRLDGYHIVSDLIGVSDLFSRIKPVLRSLVPGRPIEPRVSGAQALGASGGHRLGAEHDRGSRRRGRGARDQRSPLPAARLCSLLAQVGLVGTGQPLRCSPA